MAINAQRIRKHFFLQTYEKKAYSNDFMKAKRILLPSLSVVLIGMSGCSVRISNVTPPVIPTNPSGIYTISAQAVIKNQAVDRSNVNAFIVIDGEKHPMTASDLGNGYFDYDYTMPQGQEAARFYYVLQYALGSRDAKPKIRTKQSRINELKLIDRLSITLDTNRAPVGTQLSVLGRGFSFGDKVFVGGIEAETRFVSGSVLQFVIPIMEPGPNYPVEVRGRSVEEAGTLKVDPALPLKVIPDSLTLESGQRRILAFAINDPAPPEGLYLNVTTDIPNSVIMPEVIIPEGSRTVNVTVQGGQAGSGRLFVQALGMPEVVIPVTVD